jgi:hypothetical protein
MKKSLVKIKLFNYMAFLFLVLIAALVVTACGSTPSGNGSTDNSQEPKSDSKNPVIQTDYEISGFGVITTPGDHFGTSLQIDQVTLTSGEFYFSDLINRLDFTSTTIKSISVTGETATITADGSVTDVNGTYTCLFELTITDGDPDTFGIKINDLSGNEVYNLDPQPIDMVNGNFTISILLE